MRYRMTLDDLADACVAAAAYDLEESRAQEARISNISNSTSSNGSGDVAFATNGSPTFIAETIEADDSVSLAGRSCSPNESGTSSVIVNSAAGSGHSSATPDNKRTVTEAQLTDHESGDELDDFPELRNPNYKINPHEDPVLWARIVAAKKKRIEKKDARKAAKMRKVTSEVPIPANTVVYEEADGTKSPASEQLELSSNINAIVEQINEIVNVEKSGTDSRRISNSFALSGNINATVEQSNDNFDVEKSGTDSRRTSNASASTGSLTLMQPTMKRKTRMLAPSNPDDKALIAAATKAGSDIYDSDAEESSDALRGTKKPHLFKNVVWGPTATNLNAPDDEFPVHPEFTQFVPGRWERQPDGSVLDQKTKLVVKLTDSKGIKRIFANPPPRNWNSQEAITVLNKRTVQQIRRNTEVRFREVVTAYVQAERQWILENLQGGKPAGSWKEFVDQFNEKFAGKVLEGVEGVRPVRSHSSLTKEVERFGPRYYSKGLLPVLADIKAEKEAAKTTKTAKTAKTEKKAAKTGEAKNAQ